MTTPILSQASIENMSTPISTQPSFESSQTNDMIYIDSYHNSVAPYGPPVILGPIVPTTSGPKSVGPQPAFMACHMCNQEIKTVIFYRPTVKTHLLACCLCFIGCWPCMCIPYCMHSWIKTDHYCPYCSAFMGSYMMS